MQPHEVVKVLFRHIIGPVGENAEEVFDDPVRMNDPAFVEVVSAGWIGPFEMGVDLLCLIGVESGESRIRSSESSGESSRRAYTSATSVSPFWR